MSQIKRNNITFTPLDEEQSNTGMTSTPIEATGVHAQVPQKVRPSDPFKQGVAGVTDIVTSLPSLAGLIGAAGETVYDYATDDSDQGFMDHFVENMSEGADASLLRAGSDARQWVNNQLGIKDPVSTEDQLARILGSSFIPIPGTALTSKAGQAATLLTPLVRIGGPKIGGVGTAGRLAIETGVNAATDQAANYLMDRPLVFSEEAVEGTTPERFMELTADPYAEVTFTPLETTMTLDPNEQRLMELDAELDAEERRNNALITAGVVGTALLGYAGRRKIASMARRATGKSPKDIGHTLHSTLVDSRTAVTDELRKAGFGESVIRDMNDQIDTTMSSLGIAQQYIRDGVARVTGKKVGTINIGDQEVRASLSNLRIKVQSLDPRRLDRFNEGMKAKSDLANIERIKRIAERQGQEVDVEQYVTLMDPARGRKYTYNELQAASRALDNDIELTQIAQRLRENMDNVLDDAVRVGVIDAETVTKWRDDFTFNGNDSYMPFYTRPDEKNLLGKLKDKLWTDEQVNNALEMGRWQGRALDESVPAREVLDPIQAAERYIGETIEHTNRNAAGFNLLRRLAHRGTYDPQTGGYNLLARGNGPGMVQGNPTAALVASRKTNADAWEFDGVFVNRAANNGTMEHGIKRAFDNNAQNVAGDPNIITVRHNGREQAFYVPNKLIRDTISYRPQLHGVYAFSQFWKDLFVQGTTGNLSFFAPVSNIYGTAQIAFNAASQTGRGVIREVPAAMVDSIRGTWHLAANRISKQVADNLAMRLESNTGLASMAPQLAESLRDRLQKTFERSIVNPVIRESGAFKTTTGSTDVTSLVEDQLPIIGKGAWKNFPRQTWYMWKHLNEALREGPAVGRALREGKLDDNTLSYLAREGNDTMRESARKSVRQGTRVAKDFAGDFSRVGSSKVAKFINAAFPFSGAMIQSWNSIGRSIMRHPKAATTALTGVVGVPTMTELTWNNSLDNAYPEQGYNHHYWNVLTTDQRIANHVFYLPGLSPDQALLIPIMPEFSLGKAVVMESMDAVFGFSARGSASTSPSAELQENGDNMVRALERIADIPVPPLASAVASAAGQELSIGPERSIDQDVFETLSPFNLRSNVSGGKRLGLEGDKFTNDIIGEKVSNMMQDIFGAMGGTYAQIANAFGGQVNQSLRANESAGEAGLAGLGAGVEQVVQSSRKMAGRIPGAQTLFGKTLAPNPNNEINEEVLQKTNALTQLREDLKILQQQGVVAGSPFEGNTGMPTADPVYAFAATAAPEVLSDLAVLNKEVARLRSEITSLGNATQQYDGKLLPTVKSRHDEIDSRKLQLSAIKAQQAAIIRSYEERISQWMIEQGYENDPNYQFRFDEVKSRRSGAGIVDQLPR